MHTMILFQDTSLLPDDISFDAMTWLRLVAVLVGGAVGGWLLGMVIWRIFDAMAAREKKLEIEPLVEKTRSPGRYLVVGLGLLVAFGFSETQGFLPEWIQGWWGQALTIYSILVATWFLIRGVAGINQMVIDRYRDEEQSSIRARRIHTQVSIISRTLMIIIGIIGFALALMTFDSVERIGASLLASAGIVGIVVGLAARPVLSNIIAGIQIALTQPVRLGDTVVLAGEWGHIERITTTYVVLRVWDQRRVIVPFSKIIEQPFENWTHRGQELLGTVKLYLDYTCPIEEVRQELDRILEDNPKFDGRAKSVLVTDASERTILVRLLASSANASDQWDLRCEMRERMIAFLQKNHPYALPRDREEKLKRDEGSADAQPRLRSEPETPAGE